MKEAELRKIAICDICHNPIGACGIPLFYRVHIERYGLDVGTLQRQQGLTMMLGGHADLASVMGPNEDMANKISSTEITVCEKCSTEKRIVVAELAMRE